MRTPSDSSTERDIFVRLSRDQVARVISEAGDSGILTLLLAQLNSKTKRPRSKKLKDDPCLENPGLSSSVIIGWAVFGAFTPPGTLRGVLEVANELELSPSTTHRYIATLNELGLLERDPETRMYRIPVGNATQ